MKPDVTEAWIQFFAKTVWGWYLRDFQLELWIELLSGGIFSVMLPTDYGKSMTFEGLPAAGLCIDPQISCIGVKINQDAAWAASIETVRILRKVSALYPWAEPLVRTLYGEPVVKNGIWVKGRDRDVGRNPNPSFRFFGLADGSLQGKRARITLVDDVERREEASSAAMSKKLRDRLSAVMRTMEDHPRMTWAALGTPTHSRSIHFTIARELHKIGVRYKEIKVTPFREDGTPTWPERIGKMEIHRRTMDRAEFASAYEMRAIGSRNLSDDQLEQMVYDHELRLPDNEKDFRLQLQTWSPGAGPNQQAWLLELTKLEFYVGWDPAGDGEWAIAAVAILGDFMWVLRSHLGLGDTWDQVGKVKEFVKAFPSATVIIERNGQQKAFIDVLEAEMPDQLILPHGTYGQKDSEIIGIPALMDAFGGGRVRLPWQDAELAEAEFESLLDEVKAYGPTSHPHVIPAIWFCWYWSRKHEVKSERKAEQAQPATQEPVNFRVPRTYAVNPSVRRQSEQAWSRRHR